MGFLSKAREAQQQAKDAMAGVGSMGGLPANLQGMTAPTNMDEQLRHREKVQKLKASGIEAPAVINTITAGDAEPLSGSITTVFEVTIKPPDGDAYGATIKQSMLPAALEGLAAGDAIGVRYDPDDRTSALIYTW